MSLINKTIGQCLYDVARKYPAQNAFISSEECFTWAQVEEISDCIAGFLLSRNIGKGSHVGMWSADTPLFAICFYRAILFYKAHGYIDANREIKAVLGEREYTCKVFEKALR